SGQSILSIAATHGEFELLRYLLDQQALKQEEINKDLLNISVTLGTVRRLLDNQDISGIVKKLKENKLEDYLIDQDSKDKPLITALTEEFLKRVHLNDQKWITDLAHHLPKLFKFTLNKQNKKGETALLIAA